MRPYFGSSRLCLVILIALVVSGCRGRMKKSNYDLVMEGMSLKEVQVLLGPGEEISSARVDVPGQSGPGFSVPGVKMTSKTCIWQYGNEIITVIFINDKATGKSQVLDATLARAREIQAEARRAAEEEERKSEAEKKRREMELEAEARRAEAIRRAEENKRRDMELAVARRQAEAEEAKRRAAEKARQVELKKKADKEAALREITNQQWIPLESATAIPTGEKWADASAFAVQQDGIRVTITDLERSNDNLQIQLLLETVEKTIEKKFSLWGISNADKPRLLDKSGKQFAFVSARDSVAESENGIKHAIGLTFHCSEIDVLRLELPESVFDGYGKFRLEMPKAMVLCMLAASMGAKAVPELIPLLEDPNRRFRAEAAKVLGEFGPLASSAVPSLAKVLNGKEAIVRAEAADSLGKIKSEPKVSIPALVHASKDEDNTVRLKCVQSLAAFAPDPDVNLPLIQSLLDEDDQVMALAVETIPSLKLTKMELPAVIDAMRKARGKARLTLVTALEPLGADSKTAANSIASYLYVDDQELVSKSLDTLAKIGPDAWSSVPDIVKLLDNKNSSDELRIKALMTLRSFGPKASAASPAIIEALSVKELRGTAFHTLIKIGKGAVPDLIALLEKPVVTDYKQNVDVIMILGEIGPDAKVAAPILKKIMLSDPPPGKWEAAKNSLGKVQKK